ncbi:MAG: hypothetical protein ABIK09_17995 [Pseudomonadota bacterium]
MRNPWIMLIVLGLFCYGCDSGGGGGAADTGGSGDTPVVVVEIELGANWEAVRASVGEEPVLRDLGVLGARFEYPDLGVAGMLTGSGDDATVISLESTVTGGIAAGDPRKAVASALGDPIEDLFLDAWWYPDEGLMIEFEDDVVARVHQYEAVQ